MTRKLFVQNIDLNLSTFPKKSSDSQFTAEKKSIVLIEKMKFFDVTGHFIIGI